MPLPSSINDLSQTAGSNSPAGSESPSLLDDYLRTYASYIAQLRDNKLALSSVVGTVSQSGGVPTGSVIETGSNANGLYTKYADGTLICRFVASASVSVSNPYGVGYYGTLGWSFPIASIGVPSVSAIFLGSAGVLLPNLLALTASTANFIAFNPNSASLGTVTISYSFVMIGRWF